MTLKTRIYLLCSFLLVGCNQPKEKVETQMTEINNPILPGYFADPSLVQYEGKFYLYATVDPWGADFLPCWVSEDFRNWTFHRLNWPTKAACTSALSHKKHGMGAFCYSKRRYVLYVCICGVRGLVW